MKTIARKHFLQNVFFETKNYYDSFTKENVDENLISSDAYILWTRLHSHVQDGFLVSVMIKFNSLKSYEKLNIKLSKRGLSKLKESFSEDFHSTNYTL